MSDIHVSFAGNQALRGVDLHVDAGETVALLGKNGSGKSTLIKVLAGYHTPGRGSVQIRGHATTLPISAADQRAQSLAFVHQDLGLFERLTVAENMMVPARVVSTGLGRLRLRPRSDRDLVREVFERYGLEVDPRKQVSDLAAVEKAMVAIVRATGLLGDGAPGLLVLDEPTAFLGASETDRLFELLRQMASAGTGVLIVTHSLSDVRAVANRVVILRDGSVVGGGPVDSLTSAEIVAHIIGDAAPSLLPEGGDIPAAARPPVVDVSVDDDRRSATAEVLLAAEGLCGSGLQSLSLTVHCGEVVGVAGVLGSGAEVVPYALFGALRLSGGRVEVAGHTFRANLLQPRSCMRLGVALVPGNRLLEGLAGGLSVSDNVSLPVLGSHFKGLRLRAADLRARAAALCGDFGVTPPDPAGVVGRLSGGNQQKVLMAKWLSQHPTVLLLDEPTQGVDVGAREDLYRLIRQAVSYGTAVIWTGSDLSELASQCDRVYVLAGGRVASELVGSDLTEQRLQAAVLGSASEANKSSSIGVIG
jgi:ribose transport system ATP-binding protein